MDRNARSTRLRGVSLTSSALEEKLQIARSCDFLSLLRVFLLSSLSHLIEQPLNRLR